MKHKTMMISSALAAVFVLGALADAGAQQRRKKWDRSCSRIYVRSPEATSKKSGRRKPVFRASSILDLELRVVFPRRMAGNHDVELKVYTPKGNLYQAIPVRFNADPTEEDAERLRRRRPTAEATLPVAGTSIVTSSLYGTWRVEAHLDGAELSCTRPTRFVLRP